LWNFCRRCEILFAIKNRACCGKVAMTFSRAFGRVNVASVFFPFFSRFFHPSSLEHIFPFKDTALARSLARVRTRRTRGEGGFLERQWTIGCRRQGISRGGKNTWHCTRVSLFVSRRGPMHRIVGEWRGCPKRLVWKFNERFSPIIADFSAISYAILTALDEAPSSARTTTKQHWLTNRT